MRTGKAGLEYFPLDVDFFNDEKIELVSAKLGIVAELITIKFLSRIYRVGYFIEWNKDMAYLYAKQFGVTYDLISSVVDELLNRQFFNCDVFDKYGILTSRAIQRRYIEATKRRKQTEIISQFLLLQMSDVNTINQNVSIIDLNVCNVFTQQLQNVDIKKQSKVKESKVKESKESSCDDFEDAEIFKQAWKEYPSGCKRNAETEFNWLKKQHNDWKKILPLLKDSMIAYKQFVRSQVAKKPDYTIKHMQGWLTERRWEMYQLKNEIQEPELEFVGGFNDN